MKNTYYNYLNKTIINNIFMQSLKKLYKYNNINF